MKTRYFTLTAIFIAIIFLFAFTPFGFINLGIIKATLIHIPVIIGSIVLGPKLGALLGGVFGGTSLLINTISPSLLSFAFSPFLPVLGTNQTSFWSLFVCFVPRILVGIIPYYVFQFFERRKVSRKISLGLAGLCGSLTNTLLVMNLIYFIFKDAYAQAKGITLGQNVYPAVLAVILANGIPEAIVAIFATIAVGNVLLKIMKKNSSQLKP